MNATLKCTAFCIFISFGIVRWLRAQEFTYVTNNGAIMITGYKGSAALLTIPDTVTGMPVTCIGTNAFSGQKTLTAVTVGAGITNIQDYAFYACSALTNVSIGSGLNTIGNYAFADDTTLPSFTIPDEVATLGAGAFFDCGALTNIVLGQNLTSIGNYAFNGCSSLLGITLPANVIVIGNDAFFQCWSMGSVSLDNRVAVIGHDAFSQCSRLTSITIPDTVTNLGYFAFYSCGALTNVSLGTGITYLQDTFDRCSSLSSITLPDSITNLSNPFFGCLNLSRVYFRGNAPMVSWSTQDGVTNRTIYYLPGRTGWGETFGGFPAVLWNAWIQTGDGQFGLQKSGFGFTVTGNTNLPVLVEGSPSLSNPQWSPLQAFYLTNGSVYFSDSQRTTYSRRFYQIRWP